MKFTSALVIAALLAETNEVNALKMHNTFIDNNNLQVREEPADVPAAEAKEAKIQAAKSASAALEKSKNETAKAKMVGEKMKAAKEASDAKIEAKAEKANAAKEKEVEDGIKRNEAMLDANKKAMEKSMADSAANKIKPPSEQPPAGTTGSTQGNTASEKWTADMPQYVIDGKQGPSSKVTAAPTLEALDKQKEKRAE